METKKLLIIICILANQFFNTVNAQAPQSFNYQAVARDASGAVLSNQAVNFRISLLQGSTTGVISYTETHSVTTNLLGLVNFAIGGGTVVNGNFATINWAQGPYFAQIELDANNSGTYVIMSTTQLLSVPYAQYAEKSGNPTLQAGSGITIQNDSIINTAQNQQVNLSGTGQTNITGTYPNYVVNTPNIQAGNGISVTGQTITNAGDLSNTNEIQTLSISNDTIFLSNGGFVKLPPPYKYLKAPSVTTNAATNIQATTATLNGNVNAYNLISDVQFEFGTTTSYGTTNIGNPSKVKGLNNNSVSSNISNLLPATTYHFRAKASNAVDESLGNDLSFTTQNSVPIVSTDSVYNITNFSIHSSGTIINTGGLAIIQNGFCYSNNPNPTFSDSVVIAQNGINFQSIINNLQTNTQYHIRAFATNSLGIGYGNDIAYSTLGPITDIDGNIYNTITIGNQVWIKENLKVTKYNNGASISNVALNTSWSNLASPAYCVYNNDDNNYDSYGYLYNWFTVTSNNLCPTGFHVPTQNDWVILQTELGGETIAGGKMKEVGLTHWLTPNFGATNSSNFTGLPGGFRYENGNYANIGLFAYWWSSTSFNQTDAWHCGLQTFSESMGVNNGSSKNVGMSVRCIKD
jgi:uncharacterized protein (TIGR02145 family)